MHTHLFLCILLLLYPQDITEVLTIRLFPGVFVEAGDSDNMMAIVNRSLQRVNNEVLSASIRAISVYVSADDPFKLSMQSKLRVLKLCYYLPHGKSFSFCLMENV